MQNKNKQIRKEKENNKKDYLKKKTILNMKLLNNYNQLFKNKISIYLNKLLY